MTPTLTPKPKTPTASGISRLLAKAGHIRAETDRFTLTSGFRVTADRRRSGTVRVDYRVAHRVPENIPGVFLAAFARTIAEAGWTVEAGTYELIVTAKPEDSSLLAAKEG